MGTCKFCGRSDKTISNILSICRNCIISSNWKLIKSHILDIHNQVRKLVELPSTPPRGSKNDIKLRCNFCINECVLSENDISYCGLRNINKNKSGELPLPSIQKGYIHGYLDPIPTNCCNAWFCTADKGTYSYAAFLYGCSFNCLFCQNTSHKQFSNYNLTDAEVLANNIFKNKKITCLCYFGGTPEVQLPFTISLAKLILKKIETQDPERIMRICWEWNGTGRQDLVEKCMRIAIKTGGNIKFDLKSFDEKLNLALCGISNSRTLKNFKFLAENYFGTRGKKMPEMSGCTLMVPGYINHEEVELIANFISEINPEIPYSLLVFHGDYQMKDLPITPRKQAENCLEVATKYLKNVHMGNKFLLGFS